MVTIISVFLLLSGILATVVFAKNNTAVKSISFFILGTAVLLLGKGYFSSDTENEYLIVHTLLAILAFSFFIGELTKKKTTLLWNFIPPALVLVFFLLPDLTAISYFDFQLESEVEIVTIAILAAVTPLLTHLAKLGISNLVLRFGSIKWADQEESYLEGLVSYAFIGGISALSTFLLGPIGLLVAGTFYLSASFIARNKLGLKNDIFLSAAGAIFLLASIPIILEMADFNQLNFMRGEVLEGAFVGGFAILIYDLFLRLARFNTGGWKFWFTFKALLFPLLAILVLGMAYHAFERLGGVLSLAAFLSTMAIMSIIFTLFKDSTFIGLKLFSLGAVLVLLPFIQPIQQTSSIDLDSLGISTEGEDEAKPKTKKLDEITGKWVIDEENSKVFFELGPDDGRTKGEFKTLNGDFTVKEDVQNSKMNIVLPVKKLTTFISTRDTELMDEEYFHEKKYPEIIFKAQQFEFKDEFYEVTGDFTMKGVTKTMVIELRMIGIGEQDGKKIIVLTGESQLDRTEFGMSSSSKIGNVVDFQYEVQLEKAE